MKRLDKTRPYAEVHGDASHRYEQDGINFDAAGNAVDEAHDAPKPAPAATGAGQTVTIAGKVFNLDAMSPEELVALANDSLGLQLHKLAGKRKSIPAILAAAKAQMPDGQLADQLQA